MRRSLMSPLIIAAAMVAWVQSPASAAEQQFKFSVQSSLVSGSMYFQLLESFADRLERMSGGRLQATILPDGAVVRGSEILDAVSQEVVPAGFGWPQLWSGKHPAAYLFSNQPSVGGLDQMGLLAWYYEGDGYKLYKELYQDVLKANVEPIIVQVSGGQPLGWFKTTIASLEDFRKLKYRAPPGMTGAIFKEMGVTAVSIPGGEIVPAAQRGVIDAAEWINPGEDIKLGLQQVWKHYYLQGFHQASDLGELLFNKDFWDTLPKDLQAIIEGAARASVMESVTANIYRNAVALEQLKSEYDVQVHETPPDLYPEFIRAAETVTAEAAADDPFFAKVLESQKNFAETVVPYNTRMLGLFYSLGQTALQK